MGLIKPKDKKGMRCRENPDGSRTCERVLRDSKSGEILGDGQSVTVFADPSNGCKPSMVGDSTIFDDDYASFDEVAARVSKGCKRKQGE
jgi:hypothetical protein